MWEFVSDVYLTNAWNPKQMGFISEKVFQKLTADQQEALIFMGKKAEAIGWHQSIGIAQGAPRILAENGMNVHAASDELMGGLRKIGATMLGEWMAKADAEAKTSVEAFKAAIGR